MFQSPATATGAPAALPLWTAAVGDMQHMHMQQHIVAVQHEAPPLFAPAQTQGQPGAFGFDAPNPIGDQPMTPSGRASSSSRTNSRSSSPFSASAPLDSPLGAWEEPAAEEGTSSEGESAASLHSASRPAQAHATYVSGVATPFDNLHVHSQQQQTPNGHNIHMAQSSPPVPHPFNPLPVAAVSEHAQFINSQAAAHQQYQQQMSLMQNMLQQQMVMPPMPQVPHIFNGEELHTGPAAPQPFGIGMLQPTMPMSMLDPSNNGQEITSGPSSVVGNSNATTPNIGTSERLQVRAKRRTRYSAAAASASASTRSGIHPAFQHSSSIESSRTVTRGGGPTDNDGGQQQQQRASSSQQQSQESCGSASGQSSENEEQQQASEDEEEEEQYTAKAAPSKSTANKRKRTSSSKAAASSQSGGEDSAPNMKGLDKRERNKLSASQYRKRRKVYLDSLEGKVGELDHTIAKQGETISKMAAENRSLKEQLSFFKKLVGHINPTLLKGESNNNGHNNNNNQNYHQQQQQQQQYQQQAPAAAASQQQQPSNLHHTGSRGGRHVGGGAMGFMMIVLACILLCNPGAFLDFGGEVESGATSASFGAGAPQFAAVGRRGRTLLSVVDEPSVFVQPDALHDFTGGYATDAAAHFAPLSNETDDAAAAALLDGLTLADKVPLCAADSCIQSAYP
jgi:hypothetical protein